ncbi:hypothetical protein ZWY2020_004370 [Hordeum vulgare]|nr:hypothetical protein ZWY2020_004370 [Hordeum vulgare]
MPAMPAPSKKKNKPKKKKVAGTVPRVVVCLAPTGVLEQAAPELPSRVGRQRSRDETMCINYGCAATSDRSMSPPPPPWCPTTLVYLWYGTERGSFYFVDAEIEEEAARPHLASVTLAPKQVLPPRVVISAELMQDELAAYIGDFRDSEFA